MCGWVVGGGDFYDLIYYITTWVANIVDWLDLNSRLWDVERFLFYVYRNQMFQFKWQSSSGHCWHRLKIKSKEPSNYNLQWFIFINLFDIFRGWSLCCNVKYVWTERVYIYRTRFICFGKCRDHFTGIRKTSSATNHVMGNLFNECFDLAAFVTATHLYVVLLLWVLNTLKDTFTSEM